MCAIWYHTSHSFSIYSENLEKWTYWNANRFPPYIRIWFKKDSKKPLHLVVENKTACYIIIIFKVYSIYFKYCRRVLIQFTGLQWGPRFHSRLPKNIPTSIQKTYFEIPVTRNTHFLFALVRTGKMLDSLFRYGSRITTIIRSYDSPSEMWYLFMRDKTFMGHLQWWARDFILQFA